MRNPFKSSTKQDPTHLQVKPQRFKRFTARLWRKSKEGRENATGHDLSHTLFVDPPTEAPQPDGSRLTNKTTGFHSKSNISRRTSAGEESMSLSEDPAAKYQNGDIGPVIEALRATDLTLDELLDGAVDTIPDIRFTQISEQLEKRGKFDWSRIPRIYTLLHLMDRLDWMKNFENCTDAQIPLDAEALQKRVPSATSKDLEMALTKQRLVLSDRAKQLEDPLGHHLDIDGSADQYFRTDRTLGHGKSGFVVQVQSRLSLKQYALKTLQLSSFGDDSIDMSASGVHQDLHTLRNEIQVLKSLSHRHLITIIGSFEDNKNFGILIAPVADMDLGTFLDISKSMGPELKEGERGSTFRNSFSCYKAVLMTFYGCLAEALRFLHSQNVEHRDIKPQNILVKITPDSIHPKDSKIFLGDFGLARQWSDETLTTTTKGGMEDYTAMYAAPEIVDQVNGSPESDIWSLGCVFLEMTAILAGSTIQLLRDFLARTANREQLYYLNPTGMYHYIKHLKTQFRSIQEATPLKWVDMMTTSEREQRSSAEDVLDAILNKNRLPGYIGDCCRLSSEVNSRDKVRSMHVKYSHPTHDGETDNGKSGGSSKDGVVATVRPYSAYQLGTTTRTDTSIATESSSAVPRIRIIGAEEVHRDSRYGLDQFSKAPLRLNQVILQMIESIPWDQFFLKEDLPKADNGIVGVSDMEVRFIDPPTLARVSSILSAHYNRTENDSNMEQRRKNPILKMTKICCILHLLDRRDLLGHMTEACITDAQLPLESSILQRLPAFTDDDIESFIDNQYMTQVRDLDAKEDVTYFGEHELLPFEKISPLGAGGWGVVDKVENVFKPGKMLARKSFSISGSSQKDLEETFKREIQAMKKLSGHQHIIEFQAAYQTPKVLALLLSPVAICDLHHYLRVWKKIPKLKPRKEEILGRVFGCLPAALSFIHQHGIRYKDVKPDNILLVESGESAKLLFTDFGICYDFSQASKSITRGPRRMGTERYFAPEVPNSPKPAGTQSDIFSLGLVFLEVITVLAGQDLQNLYDTLPKDFLYYEQLELLKSWLAKLKKYPTPPKCPVEIATVVDWVANMLQKEKDKRLRSDALVRRISEDTGPRNRTSSVFCRACQTEVRENTSITLDQSPDLDDASTKSHNSREITTDAFDNLTYVHMREMLTECLRALYYLYTTLFAFQSTHITYRLKFELIRLLNFGDALGLLSGQEEPAKELRDNHLAIRNLLIQQKSLLENHLFEIPLEGNLNTLRLEGSTEESQYEEIPASISPRLLNVLKDILATNPQKLSDLRLDDTALEHLTLQISAKNDSLRRGVLNAGTKMKLREMDEDANLGLLELCNTTKQLVALVTAVSPDLVESTEDPEKLIAAGWPVPSKVKPSNSTHAGLISKEALALFARFKAINISENSRRDPKQLEISKSQLVSEPSLPHPLGESLEYPPRRQVILFRDSNQVVKPVWIEWKECRYSEIDDREHVTLPRIRELVALLSDRDKPKEFRAPICAGYFRQKDMLGLIFENSEPASVSVSVEPISLYQLYDVDDLPDDSRRLKLAHELSRCLLYLHAASWIHKGLSSYATIFFRRTEGGHVELHEPFLSGFDYSRPSKNEMLTEKPPFHPQMEFYRHPKAVMASNYRREWDIYSLGIVLIEIAHWKPLHRILGFDDPGVITLSDVRNKRKNLLGELDHLPSDSCFRGQYAEIIKACLSGGKAFGVEDADEQDPVVSERLQASFYLTVIKVLQALASEYQRPLGSAREDMVRTKSVSSVYVE